MFERYTGKVMFNMVDILISVIYPNWKENILTVFTDGACNITVWFQGVVTRLYNASTIILVQVWCDDHQIELVMG